MSLIKRLFERNNNRKDERHLKGVNRKVLEYLKSLTPNQQKRVSSGDLSNRSK